jgi:hypothetical protein
MERNQAGIFELAVDCRGSIRGSGTAPTETGRQADSFLYGFNLRDRHEGTRHHCCPSKMDLVGPWIDFIGFFD